MTDQQHPDFKFGFPVMPDPPKKPADQQRSEAVLSDEWVLNELHLIEQFQSSIEGEQNPSAVALRRAIEIVRDYEPLQKRVKNLAAINQSQLLKIEKGDRMIATQQAAINSFGNSPNGFDFAVLDKIDEQERTIAELRAEVETAQANATNFMTEIRFGPNKLTQSEEERRAIAAGNRLAELVMLRHANDCKVHEPTLRPCSCGLETRMRQLIADIRAAIAERDATIAALREEVDLLRTGRRCTELELEQIAALQARVRELETALVIAAIPLEALRASECDKAATALCRDVQNGIINAVDTIRETLDPTPTTEK